MTPPAAGPGPLPPFIITKSYTTPGEHIFTVPNGVTQMTIEVWGGGGRGGSKNTGTDASAGGGGGAYSSEVISVTPGESYVLKVGDGSTSNTLPGEDSWMSTSGVNQAFVLAKGGQTVPSNGTTGADGGFASEGIGLIKYSGGRGADRSNNFTSGGGGSSAGTGAQGNNGVNNAGGIAPTGGGDGGNGRTSQGSGSPGLVPGGGGGGSVRGSAGSPSGGNGAKGQVLITYTFVVDAGVDISQCHNALFNVSTTTPPTGFSPVWSIISGTGYIYNPTSGNTTVHVPAGSSATVRLTVTDGVTSGTDDIILSNTTGCVPGCSDPINLNYDLEVIGTADALNLNFQNTPATLINQSENPIGWSPEYNSNNPNTTNFTGAYYIQKYGAQGNPHSGNAMIYLGGENFGVSGMESDMFVQCGRTYRISVWIAAFSNDVSQANSNFITSYSAGGTNTAVYSVSYNLVAPASTSWNTLNWQRYSFDITVPANGYDWSKLVFTTLHNTNGIVIDDLCIEEIEQGSYANAGVDTFACFGNFNLSANQPDPGYTGSWSVVSGDASISQPSSPTSSASLITGNVARLRWTMTGTGEGNTLTLIDPKKEGGFENGSTFATNGWTSIGGFFNPWNVGESVSPTSGNRSAYISYYDNDAHGYFTGTSSTSHFYRDVIFHPEATDILLSFKWKGMGESGYDRLLVYTAPTGVTPSTGVPASPSTTISGATLVSSLDLHSSTNYQTVNITLPGSLAGTTSRLIFTWQNDANSGLNPPTSIDEISLTHKLAVCNTFDDVVIGYANSNFSISNDTICIGDTATISANGCDFGSILWSTDEITESIQIFPSTTTSYSATCTPNLPANLLLNPGYESTTDLQFWTANGISPTITTVASEVRSGTKAVKLDGSSGYSSIFQPIDVLPGERYVLKAWAKTTNTNKNPRIAYNLYSASWISILLEGEGKKIIGSEYQEYLIEFIIPPDVFHMNVFAEINGGILFVDDWALYKYTACVAEETGEVWVNPLPTAPAIDTITHPTCVVPTGSALLIGLPPTGDWTITQIPGGLVYNGTGPSFLITGLNPNTTFNFAVTNYNGCMSPISADVNINEIPSDPVLSGDNHTCVGSTANVLPSSEGLWTSSNPTLATITNEGLVSGVLPGSVDLTYTRDVDGCSSTKIFNIYANPLVPFVGSITQPTCILPSGSVELQNLPSVGDYIITRYPDEFIYNGNGSTFNAGGLPPSGNYTFILQDVNGCFSPVSANVSINGIPSNPVLGGDTLTCVGTSANVIPSTGGSWFSADTTFAVITNQGLVTGISSGVVTLTYTRTVDGCSSDVVFTVYDNPTSPNIDTIIQTTCVVPFGSVELGGLPSSGNWTITILPDNTSINESGSIYTVTSLAPDSSYTFYVVDSHGCISPTSANVVINPIPTDPVLSGDTTVCVGANAQVYPDSGGIWTSGNLSIATVLNDGQVTGTGPGLVSLTYTRNIDGCDNNVTFEVFANPIAPVVGVITAPTCTTPFGSVEMSGLPDIGSWTLTATPGGATYSDIGEIYTVDSLSPNTTYTFTVTDFKNCVSAASANIVINPIPTDPVLSGDPMVCVGAYANVFPNVGGVWLSGDTALATIQNNGSFMGISEGLTTLTYTRNSDGCDATMSITINQKPTSPILGTVIQPTCTVPTGSVEVSGLPSSGNWEILVSPEGASYLGNGTTHIVDNLPPGNNYTLTVSDLNGCISDSTTIITIFEIPEDPVIGGDTVLCLNATTNITPATGGVWFSANTTVATVTNTGVVTGIGASSVILTYTRDSDGCSSDVNITVQPLPLAPAVGTIIQPTCTTPTGSVFLSDLPASGDWVITRNPGDTIYMDSGTTFTVTELPPGSTYTFSLVNQYNCLSVPSAQVNILNIPSDPVVSGSDAICMGLTTNLSPASAGTWTSSNTAIATVTPAGLVNAISAGNVLMTYTRNIDGCQNAINFTVYPKPDAILESFEVCLDSTLIITATPGTGLPLFTYLWSGPNGFSSTDQNVVRMNATVSMSGLYSLTITDSNGCFGTTSITAVVNPKPLFSVSITDVSVFNGTDGAIDLSVSGGTPPFTYLWSNGATTQDLTNLFHGLYTVTITDSKSCRTFNLTEFSVGHPANCSGFRTQTQGGWGSTAFEDNAGAYRDANFAAAFPSGLEIGCDNTLVLTTTESVQNYLPCGGTAELLPVGTLTDPDCMDNYFSGQLIALTLNVIFDLYDPDFAESDENFVDLRIGSGPFYGMSVQQLLDEANNLIGGCGSSFSITEVVTALTNANENYVDGKVTGEFLVCCQINLSLTDGTICSGDSINIIANASNGILPFDYAWSDGLGTGTEKLVSPVTTKTYFVSVTDDLGCTEVTDGIVNVNPTPTVSINAPSVCENATLLLTPFLNSGTPSFTYSWTGPNGFTSSTGVVSRDTATVEMSGNYSITVTDILGCSATASSVATINENPEAPVLGEVTDPLCIPSTGSVILEGLPDTGSWTVQNLFDGTLYNGSGDTILIEELQPTETYTFIVINNNFCASPGSLPLIMADQPPNPELGGNIESCVQGVTYVYPGEEGIWLSNNSSVASVDNLGQVNALAAGTTTLTYIRDSDGCSNSLQYTVYSNPIPPVISTITQPTCITPTGSVVLSDLPELGNWTIIRYPGAIAYQGFGASLSIQGLPISNTYSFTVINSNNCTSPVSANAIIEGMPVNPVVIGLEDICVGDSTNVTPSSGGVWVSSNPAVADINNVGLVHGLTTGNTTLTYTRNSDGCINSLPFVVNDNPTTPIVDTIIQPTCTTPNGSVTLSGLPSVDSWTVVRMPGMVQYSGSGTTLVVSGLPPGQIYTFFVRNSNECLSPVSMEIVINDIPANPVLGGALEICMGNSANVTPSSNGIWSSSNNTIATINNTGLVTGMAAGVVTLTYVRDIDGCQNTKNFNVRSNPGTPFVGTIVQPTCTTPTGSVALSNLPPTGTWTITMTPGGNTFMGTGASYNVTSLPIQQTYTFIVTNQNNCNSPVSANVTILGIPANPVLSGDTAVCVGSIANVSPINLGNWSSSDDTIASITNQGVVMGNFEGVVILTYTRIADGCYSTLNFEVHNNPESPIISSVVQPTCVIPYGSISFEGLPENGTWTLTQNPFGTTYMGTGSTYTVNSLPIDTTYVFTVTNDHECISTISLETIISAMPEDPVPGGDDQVCVGLTANVTPEIGGTWSSSNQTIAEINNFGLVTGVGSGSVTLQYIRDSDGCTCEKMFTVYSNPSTPFIGTVTQATCLVPTGSVVIGGLPASGNWQLMINPGGQIISGTGSSYEVTELTPDDTYTFTVSSEFDCSSPVSADVEIFDIPLNPTLGGDSLVCMGSTSIMTPTTNGVWISSNQNIVSINNSGVATGVGVGNVTLTYTRTADGCLRTKMLEVKGLPAIPQIESVTQPTCLIPTGSIVLNGLPSSGNWIITKLPGGVQYSGTGTRDTISGLAPDNTYTFTVKNLFNCISQSSVPVEILPIPDDPILGGIDAVCVGDTSMLTPSGFGEWTSSEPSLILVSNEGMVTTYAAGSAVLIYTRTIDGCTSYMNFYSNPNPNAEIVGLPIICSGGWAVLEAVGGVIYQWNNGSNNSTIFVDTSGLYSVTVTNSYGCSDIDTQSVTISYDVGVEIDYNGSVCFEPGKEISAIGSDGIPPYTFNWTGPSGMTSNTQSIVIGENGIYNVTITDSAGCTSTTSGFVHQNYDPLLVSLNATVCEGQGVELSIDSEIAVQYLWSENAGSATTPSVFVYPSFPSSTYYVTVTNELGCTAVPSLTINVNPKPIVSLSGPSEICIGAITEFTFTGNGSWQNINPGVATINSQGIVVGLSPGMTRFILTSAPNNCPSDTTVYITVYDNPEVSIDGPAFICIGQNVQLEPSAGGSWLSSNPSVATVDSSGIVTGLSAGTVVFIFTDSITGCTSYPTDVVTIENIFAPVLTGPDEVCVGSNIFIMPDLPGGMWTISDPSIASVSNTGIVTGLSPGLVEITYTLSEGSCVEYTIKEILVIAKPTIVLTGSDEICEGDTTSLIPNTGGQWTSSNPAIASISDEGIVAALQAGLVTFIFQDTTTGCQSNSSVIITIHAKPVTSLLGLAQICIGTTTTFAPTSGGNWNSSDPLVAVIDNNGEVTAIAEGMANFTFMELSTGCTSEATMPIQVHSNPSLSIDYHGSICLQDSSELSVIVVGGSPSFNYLWSGPQGFEANTQNIFITVNGNYEVTVTDNAGCSASISGFVYEQFQPIVTNLNTSVCEGDSALLSVSTNIESTYLWSDNAGNSTDSLVMVTPEFPSSTYSVTVTNPIGCVVVAEAIINVNATPTITFDGPQSICVGSTTNLQPGVSGTWTSLNPSVATITNVGLVTGLIPGTARFLYTNSSTQCTSDTSDVVTVHALTPILYEGPTEICSGNQTQLNPASGGNWVSNNPSIANVDSSGMVTAISGGVAIFNFTNDSGCVSDTSVYITVHDSPDIVLNGPDQICTGTTTQFLPSMGGTWESLQPSIASIDNNGNITGLQQGDARFLFTNTVNGCISDTSEIIEVLDSLLVTLLGPSEICIGTITNVLPSSGGLWVSNQPLIASISNSGMITGLQAGTATFTYTSNSLQCYNGTSMPITVNPRPTGGITGPLTLCIGDSTTVSPVVNGTWTSSNPAVASVNAGKVFAISAGSANFIFTSTITGCASFPTNNVSIYARPIVSVTGSDFICEGSTTQLFPTNGGNWISSNPTVASVNNSGVVTGHQAGMANFNFIEAGSGCMSLPTDDITVLMKPDVSFAGPTEICQDLTTQLDPATGGSWVSLQPSIASVTSSGLVVGLTNGIARFVFTTNQGCISDPTTWLTVHSPPQTLISGDSDICIGETTQALPNTGGVWLSSNPSVATINNSGLITGVGIGNVRFIFTDNTTGCQSDSTEIITVQSQPSIGVIGTNSICIGLTAILNPTTGGEWISLTPSIASVNNNGIVNGLSAGFASFRFTSTATGCSADLNDAITIKPRPATSFGGPSVICVGGTTNILPSSGGVWTSLDPTIATATNNGLVTSVNTGTARFRFTDSITGCSSAPNLIVSVLSRPSISLNGPSSICIGGNTELLPSSGGTWTSTDPSVATINDEGFVTGTGIGSVQFYFTSQSSGCQSLYSESITVSPSATLFLSGPGDICVGYGTQLSSNSSGIWHSMDTMKAIITTDGRVTGLAPGKANFYFIESESGCITQFPSDIVSINNCVDPDFNVSIINVTVQGNLSTNDEMVVGTHYLSTPSLISKPAGAVATLNIQSNGVYTFTANMIGQYRYYIQVCLPDMTINCPQFPLTINVIEPIKMAHGIIPNVDLATIYKNQTIEVAILENDRCINSTICTIDSSDIIIQTQGNHGMASFIDNQFIEYIPNTDYIGSDTILYRICASNDSLNCRFARLVVVVKDTNAENSLSATDDFYFLDKNDELIGVNVTLNDMDPEGQLFEVTPVGTPALPVNITNGAYSILSNGTLHFIPAENYVGPIDIPYEICDDDGSCVRATAHILVLDHLKIKLRAYIEGSLVNNGGQMGPDNKPLMRDNLRLNPFTGSIDLPSFDPYSYPHVYFDLTGLYQHVGKGGLESCRNIQNPASVFSVTGHNAIVDWVFVELRNPMDSSHVLATRSGLLQRDGDVVDLDGVSDLEFSGIRLDSCYIVLRHRNHFGVMSLVVPTENLLDFTSPLTPVFDFGNTLNTGFDYSGLALKPDDLNQYMCMWAGDFDGNGKLKFINPDDDQNVLFFEVLTFPTNGEFYANFNFSYGYFQGDFDMNGKVKYDNPNDDKNFLFYQILFHPLNEFIISNFNAIIQQVPDPTY